MRSQPVHGVDEIVQELVEQGIAKHHPGRTIRFISRRPYEYRTSFGLDRLEVTLDGGSVVSLVLKDLSRRSLPATIRDAKPEIVASLVREIAVYRDLLAPISIGPAFYGAIEDPARDLFLLLVALVPGRELFQIGEVDIWTEVARWLARFHEQFRGDVGRCAQLVPSLLRHDEAFYRVWPARAVDYARRRRIADEIAALEWIAVGYEAAIEQLVAAPQTLIHGEFFASNVLADGSAGSLRVCPVDWEMAALGPGPIDLAAMVAGSWGEHEREVMTAAYRAALALDPVADASFHRVLLSCRLHLALQWLGWSENWQPPAEHRQDWLAEAVSLAEQLFG